MNELFPKSKEYLYPNISEMHGPGMGDSKGRPDRLGARRGQALNLAQMLDSNDALAEAKRATKLARLDAM